MIALGKKVFIRGSDIPAQVRGMCKLSRKSALDDFKLWLAAYHAKRLSRLEKAQDEDAIKQFNELINVTKMLMALDEVNDVADLVRVVETLFRAKGDDAIMFSTVHRAKGMESDTVYVLNNFNRDTDNQEEDNIWYVACTRARHKLVLVEG